MTERSLKLLLVEDSADDAELISRALRHGGYAAEISRVENEETLRTALAENEFDLVVTDHLLPGFDSEGVLRTLAEAAPALPCVLVSGKVGEEAVGAAMRQGAVDYVSKDDLGGLPVALERALAESLRLRQLHASEDALARSGRLFEAVFVNAGDAMLIADDERRVVAANPAAASLFATHREELVGLRAEDLLPAPSPVDIPHEWAEFLSSGEARGEIEVLRSDGVRVATEYTAAANFAAGRHILVMRDIRRRRAAEIEAARHSAQQEAVAELGELALREKDLDVLMDAAVRRVATTLGVEVVSLLELRAAEYAFVVRAQVGLGQTLAGARVPHGSGAGSQTSYTVNQTGPVLVNDCTAETRFDRDPIMKERGARSVLTVEVSGHLQPFGVLAAASSTPGAFEADGATFLSAVANILADALTRARSEDEMRELALHDPLTGLPNRTFFFDRLTLALARNQRLGTRLAVLFLDVDGFKAVNDTLGHRATDRLLTQVGARIERTMREHDTVARFGGDEFVVLCEDVADEEEAEVLTTRLVSAFEAPFWVAEERHELSASIGVALSDEDNLDSEALLRDADIAMYRSKESGRGMWTLATKELRLAVVERLETKRALEKAIEADELVLHYQPIVALDGGKLRSVEALVRWETPDRGLIGPGQFIGLAEESALIVRLGEWILSAACRQAARWRAEFGDGAPLPVHVNLSARQVAQVDLPELVRRILEETGVRPGDIALEITESALIEGVGGPMAALAELKRMGVSIVLDDFGTGYSSLSYLDRFPIDTLKIDRAFVSQLEDPAAPAPIVTAIVGMARALAVETVAEGVETAEQTAAVAALGCRYAQGYFFARPAPAEHITQLVRDDSPLRERAAQATALAPPALALERVGPRLGIEGSGAETVARYREPFLAALLDADSGAAAEVVHAALWDQIGPDTIDAHIIGAAMVEIGLLWQQGEISVAQEHLATGIASQATAIAASAEGFLRTRLIAPLPLQTALLANVDGDEHVLGLRMVADTLDALGVEVRYLGGKVPQSELCDLAAETQPEIICLSLTLPDLASRLEEQATALQAACPGALLLVGGQGVPPGLPERLGATFVSDVEALVASAIDGLLSAALRVQSTA